MHCAFAAAAANPLLPTLTLASSNDVVKANLSREADAM